MLRRAVLILSHAALAQDEPPQWLDDRLKIELFAEHPEIVAPTGK
jgi:hypothetical protein